MTNIERNVHRTERITYLTEYIVASVEFPWELIVRIVKFLEAIFPEAHVFEITERLFVRFDPIWGTECHQQENTAHVCDNRSEYQFTYSNSTMKRKIIKQNSIQFAKKGVAQHTTLSNSFHFFWFNHDNIAFQMPIIRIHFIHLPKYLSDKSIIAFKVIAISFEPSPPLMLVDNKRGKKIWVASYGKVCFETTTKLTWCFWIFIFLHRLTIFNIHDWISQFSTRNFAHKTDIINRQNDIKSIAMKIRLKWKQHKSKEKIMCQHTKQLRHGIKYIETMEWVDWLKFRCTFNCCHVANC